MAPLLEARGFAWVEGPSGDSSGGPFDSGSFVRSDRRLELHFRFGLGLVTYVLGDITLSHESYMRHTGHRAVAMYPGVSSDPLDGFRFLAHDLEAFGADFLEGSGQTLADARLAADKWERLSGFAKLEAR